MGCKFLQKSNLLLFCGFCFFGECLWDVLLCGWPCILFREGRGSERGGFRWFKPSGTRVCELSACPFGLRVRKTSCGLISIGQWTSWVETGRISRKECQGKRSKCGATFCIHLCVFSSSAIPDVQSANLSIIMCEGRSPCFWSVFLLFSHRKARTQLVIDSLIVTNALNKLFAQKRHIHLGKTVNVPLFLKRMSKTD